MRAINDPAHPAHHMMERQRQQRPRDCTVLQLPEPFSGRAAKLRIAVIGLNPGIDFDEKIPTEGWSRENYFDFYRARFDHRHAGGPCAQLLDGRFSPVRFWSSIERFFRHIGGVAEFDDFRLGEHAVLHEAIRYKSAGGWTGGNAKQRFGLRAHQGPFLHAALSATDVDIVLAVGSDAWAALRKMLDGLDGHPELLRDAAKDAPYVASHGGRKLFIVPVKHLSGGRPTKEELSCARSAMKQAWRRRGELA